jgi:hypothetical protein
VGSAMTINHLCLIFGATPSRCSDVINSMMEKVVIKLTNNHFARIQFPKTELEKKTFARLVELREPRICDVIGFADGVAIHVQCSSNLEEQATNYNGYHHDTMR